jgi:sulfide:quinone oxidoreductase
LLRGKRIVILGAGFGGLASANFLRKNLSDEHQITVIDKKDYFLMGFVNLWILNGNRNLEDSKIALSNLKNKRISFLQQEVIRINPVEKTITTTAISSSSSSSTKTTTKQNHEYDYLIIALGVEYSTEQINGFMKNRGFNLYDAEQIPKLRKEILSLKEGKIAICITSLPYKCPPAPYEASLIVNDILIKNKTRENIDIDVYTPSPIALPVAGPKVSQDVVNLLDKNNIHFNPSCSLQSVSDTGLTFKDGKGISKENVEYNLLISVLPHTLPSIIKNSKFIDQDNQKWINVDKFTLKTRYENVYAIGDVTEIKVNQNVSIPKAGIFAEGQAKVVCQQIIDDIKNQSSNPKFDGKGFCFMEIGDNKAGYIDTDFYNKEGPITRLDPPNEESYKKKVDFEKNRIQDWLL